MDNIIYGTLYYYVACGHVYGCIIINITTNDLFLLGRIFNIISKPIDNHLWDIINKWYEM